MVQLSIINPHTIFTLFARLNFFYKNPPLQAISPPISNTDHEVYISSSVVDFKRYHLLKPKKNNLF